MGRGQRSGDTRLIVPCAHSASIRRPEATVADAVDAIVRANPVDRSSMAGSVISRPEPERPLHCCRPLRLRAALANG